MQPKFTSASGHKHITREWGQMNKWEMNEKLDFPSVSMVRCPEYPFLFYWLLSYKPGPPGIPTFLLSTLFHILISCLILYDPTAGVLKLAETDQKHIFAYLHT